MRYKVIKGSALYSVLTEEEKKMRFEVVRTHQTSKGVSYYTIEGLRDDNSLFTIGALPDEIYPVDLNYSEFILDGIKEDVNNFINK